MNVLLAAEISITNAADRIAYWERMSDYAYPAFFTLFALAAALVLVSSVRSSGVSGGSMLRSRGLQAGFIILLVLCAIANQTTIDHNRGFIADEQVRYDRQLRELEKRTDKEEVLRAQYLYMPVGSSLAYMTAGNTGIAADYLWLTSMQYVASSFRRGHKFEMLQRFYTTMLELDPHWVDAHVNAGKILSALEPDRFAVEKFYTQAVVANPDDWRLPYAAGRLFVVPPMNLEQQSMYSDHAIGWLRDAMRRPTFPPDMVTQSSNLISLLSVEAGYFEEADRMLFLQATDEKGDVNFRQIAARDWMNVHSIRMARDLEQLVKGYKDVHGAFPPNLVTALRHTNNPNALEEFKSDAFGYPFDYDAATGKVQSRGVNVRKALTIDHVLSTLINMYRSDHADAPPPTLEDLRTWVREFYSSPGNAPSSGLKDAIGSDLDPTRCPIGKWDYNPSTGVITLPEWCNATQLYARTDEVMNMKATRGTH